jgi:ribosomal-protein-alanine N-acetyltransferase
MGPDEVAAVAAIDRRSQPSPWSESEFLAELQREWAHVDIARAAQPGRTPVVGFCNYWLVGDEVQLLNLATDPEWRRRGVASRLLDRLLAFARDRACTLVTLEVRASNDAARALYTRRGFRDVGVRKRYYPDTGEDALLMDLALS